MLRKTTNVFMRSLLIRHKYLMLCYDVNTDNCIIAVLTLSFCLFAFCPQDGVPSELDDDDDIIFEHSESQSDRKTSGSMASSDVLTVNQLIESVCVISLHLLVCLLASDHAQSIIFYV